VSVRATDIGSISSAPRVEQDVVLQPIAAPSILGLYGFAGATFIVAARMAGWYGGPESKLFLFPFAAMFGGVAQFLAGMWAYRARDALATAMHGMWGAFWMGYGLLNLLFVTGYLVEPTPAFPELGFWFVALGAITWMGFVAACAENAALAAVLFLLAGGSTIAAIANIAGIHGLGIFAGWWFILSALLAWYTATAMMFEATFRRPILPVGQTTRAAHAAAIASGAGEPGVLRGQAPPARKAG
jgi:succinate-acetate transporter protein